MAIFAILHVFVYSYEEYAYDATGNKLTMRREEPTKTKHTCLRASLDVINPKDFLDLLWALCKWLWRWVFKDDLRQRKRKFIYKATELVIKHKIYTRASELLCWWVWLCYLPSSKPPAEITFDANDPEESARQSARKYARRCRRCRLARKGPYEMLYHTWDRGFYRPTQYPDIAIDYSEEELKKPMKVYDPNMLSDAGSTSELGPIDMAKFYGQRLPEPRKASNRKALEAAAWNNKKLSEYNLSVGLSQEQTLAWLEDEHVQHKILTGHNPGGTWRKDVAKMYDDTFFTALKQLDPNDRLIPFREQYFQKLIDDWEFRYKEIPGLSKDFMINTKDYERWLKFLQEYDPDDYKRRWMMTLAQGETWRTGEGVSEEYWLKTLLKNDKEMREEWFDILVQEGRYMRRTDQGIGTKKWEYFMNRYKSLRQKYYKHLIYNEDYRVQEGFGNSEDWYQYLEADLELRRIYWVRLLNDWNYRVQEGLNDPGSWLDYADAHPELDLEGSHYVQLLDDWEYRTQEGLEDQQDWREYVEAHPDLEKQYHQRLIGDPKYREEEGYLYFDKAWEDLREAKPKLRRLHWEECVKDPRYRAWAGFQNTREWKEAIKYNPELNRAFRAFRNG